MIEPEKFDEEWEALVESANQRGWSIIKYGNVWAGKKKLNNIMGEWSAFYTIDALRAFIHSMPPLPSPARKDAPKVPRRARAGHRNKPLPVEEAILDARKLRDARKTKTARAAQARAYYRRPLTAEMKEARQAALRFKNFEEQA